MNLKEAYEIIGKDDLVVRDNGTPGYFFFSKYPPLTPENVLTAIELINCDIANTFTNWHCQCGLPGCKW